ncbi:MAG: hypothetical protein L6R42_006125 [Xanthoria sp. 1 TBL-2021]|nr:MAG: hypothetical protein L6R42_006125 [Xanthoria sp. 1 TBL-2021]
MYPNGTIDAFDLATKAGVFPNGRMLLNSFTEWKRLDLNIATLVYLVDGMTNGSDPAPDNKPKTRLVGQAGFSPSNLHPPASPHFIHKAHENNYPRPRQSPPPHNDTNLLPHRNNHVPISHPHSQHSPTPNPDRVVPSSTTLHRNRSNHPRLLNLYLLPTTIRQTTNHSLLFAAQFEKQRSRTLKKTTLHLSTFFSASMHIYCLLAILFSFLYSSPSTTYFSSVYIPSPTSVHPNFADIIAKGAFLLMQYDNIIISVACALLCYMVVSPHFDLGATRSKSGLAVGIAVATMLLGPGAVGSLGFAWREGKGQASEEEEAVGKEKSMPS